MTNQPPLSGQLAILLGIASQLYTTRMTAQLEPHGLSLSQLAVLSHCARHPDQRWTVSGLATVMEINQPGITKIVQKLLGRALLHAQPDADDARKKHLQITPAGIDALQAVYEALDPDVEAWFRDWTVPNMEQFRASLETLIGWFDSHRLAKEE
ncbi:MAG TPA: MarR family transcriptional regulator [Herpetosiphonaceae bacterium]